MKKEYYFSQAQSVENRLDGYVMPYGSGSYYDDEDPQYPIGYRSVDHGSGKTNVFCAETCVNDPTCDGYEFNNQYSHCHTYHDVPEDPKLKTFESPLGTTGYYKIDNREKARVSIKKAKATPTVKSATVYLAYGKNSQYGGPDGSCKNHLPNSEGNILYMHPVVTFGSKVVKMSYYDADCHKAKEQTRKFLDGTSYKYFSPNSNMRHGIRISAGYKIVDKPMKFDDFISKNIFIKHPNTKHDTNSLIAGVVIDIEFVENVTVPPKRIVSDPIRDDGWMTSHGISGTNGTPDGKGITVYIAGRMIKGDKEDARQYDQGFRWVGTASNMSKMLWVDPPAKELYSTAVVREVVLPDAIKVQAMAFDGSHSYEPYGNPRRRWKGGRGCFNSMNLGVLGESHSSAPQYKDTYKSDDVFGDWQVSDNKCISLNDPKAGFTQKGGSGKGNGAPCPGPAVFWQWNDKSKGIVDCWYDVSDFSKVLKHRDALEQSGLNGESIYSKLESGFCKLPGNATVEYDPSTNKNCSTVAGEQLFEDCSKDSILLDETKWGQCKTVLDDQKFGVSFKGVLEKFCKTNPKAKICGCFNPFRDSGAFCQKEENKEHPGCKEVNAAVEQYRKMIESLKSEAQEAGREVAISVITKLTGLIEETQKKPSCYGGVCLDGNKEWKYDADSQVTCPPQQICIQSLNVGNLEAIGSNVKLDQSCETKSDAGTPVTETPPAAGTSPTEKKAEEKKAEEKKAEEKKAEEKKADEKSTEDVTKTVESTTPETPKWVLPAMVVLGLLFFVMIIKKKKGGGNAVPQSQAMMMQPRPMYGYPPPMM